MEPIEKKLEKISQNFSGGILDLDTVFIRLNDCSAKGDVCLPLSLGQSLKMRFTDNGKKIPVTIQNGCDFDTTSAYTYSTLFGQGNFGPYLLTSWPVSGQMFADTFNTMPELVDSMNSWDPNGNWMLDPSHLLITGGNAGNIYDTMKVFVLQIQTQSFIGYNFGTTPRGTNLTFEKGFHEVILEDTTTFERDTFYVQVACNSTENRVVQKDSASVFCPNFDDLLTAPKSVSLCNSGNSAVSFNLNSNNCVEYFGKIVGSASTCIVACDSTGFCDTVFLNLKVDGKGSRFFHYLEIAENSTGTLCPDTSSLGGAVKNRLLCSVSLHGFATFSLDAAGTCLQYFGKKEGGVDTICLAACDEFGLCDTTVLAVKVRRFGPDFRYDTVFLNQMGRQCVDSYLLPGNLKKLEIFKMPDPLMFFYNLEQVEFCATYTGLKPGTDTMGVRLKDDLGNYDSTFLILTVVKPAAQTIVDTFFLGETQIFCLDKTELGGSDFYLKNICEKTSNRHVSFDLNDLTLCLEIQALNPGTDTACITLCDNLGVCDTVIFLITALDDSVNPQPPVANPDNGLSQNSQPTEIRVLENDASVTSFTDILVLPTDGSIGPLHGEVKMDKTTGVATYSPEIGFCNSTDNFRYVVCNSVGCDTALVTVLVMCDTSTADDKLLVFNAFSPNGDDANETFFIENIEKYPASEVMVFNRWGNLVLDKINYQNDWAGEWQGKMLPDAVYFYHILDGKGAVLEGVLVLKR